MGAPSFDALGARLFDTVQRVPGVAPLITWIAALPASARDGVYWLTALVGLIPALRAGLLFPHRWLAGIEVNYSFGWIENPLGLGALAGALIILVLAAASRETLRLLPIVPYLAILIAGEPGSMLSGFNSVYVVSAFAVFVFFIWAGRLFSWYFGGFVVLLYLWQIRDDLLSSPQIVQFLIVASGLALLREIFAQNRQLLRHLGRQNLAALVGRTFLLWWPTLILIGIGLGIGWLLSSSTEKLLFRFTLVDPHCSIVGAPESGLIICDDDTRESLQKSELTPLNDAESFNATTDWYYNEAVMEIERYFEGLDVAVWATKESATLAIDEMVKRLKASRLTALADAVYRRNRSMWSLNAPSRKILAEYGAEAVDPEVMADYAQDHFHEIALVLKNYISGPEAREINPTFFELIFNGRWADGRRGGGRGGRPRPDRDELIAAVKKLIMPFCALDDGQTFPCPDGLETTETFPLERVGFRPSLTASVDKEFIVQRDAIDTQLGQANARLLASKDGAYDAALEVYSVIPPSLGFEEMECGELELKCRLIRLVKTELDSAYRDARDAIGEEFALSMQAKANSGALQAHNAVAVARADLNDALEDWRWRTKASIERAYIVANVVDLVMYFWLALMAIKSLLYVFARVIFDRKTDIALDLVEETAARGQGSIDFVEELVIPGSYPHDMYYKSRYQPLGPAPRFSIPQWRTSIASRLVSGSYNMAKVDMPLEDGGGLTFNATEAQHLVDWQLEEGEEVIFNYRNFVAMNGNIQLRTIISLRVATLLMGRYVFHTAKCVGGPGRLILRTRGKPATPEQLDQSIPIARLVAWSRYARFSVDSHLTTQDVFLNGFNLRRDPDPKTQQKGNLVVEADAREGGLLVGTLRFAKHFVLPV